MISTSVIDSAAQLAQLEPRWGDLLERSEAGGPMLSPAWLGSWWEVFGAREGRELRVVTFEEQGRLVGIAPLLARRHTSRAGIAWRRLELLGCGEREADEICSEYLGLVVERGREQAVVEAFARALVAAPLTPWDELVLPAMSGESCLPSLLAATLAPLGVVCHAITGGAPYVPLPATWEDYVAGLSTSSRALVRRSLRAFDRWAAGEAVVRRAEDRCGLREGIDVLVKLHRARWGVTGCDVFSSAPFRAFHERVMPRLLDEGALDLSWVCVRGEPVAALYNVVWRDRVLFYQAGRRVGLPATIRPGLVTHLFAIQRAIAAGAREYDFLDGAARFKRALTSQVRPLREVRVRRPSLAEKLRRWAAVGLRAARAAQRALRSRVAPRQGEARL